VYIRSKPNTSSSKLGSIKAGKVATYLGSSSTDSRGVKWYKVKYNGVTGWVSSRYSKVGNYSSSSSSSGSSSSVSGNTVKATGDIYIRSKANKSSSALGSMKKGAVATYLGSTSTDSRGVKWYKVKYNGVTGWVSSKYSKVGYYSSGSSDDSSTSGDTVKIVGGDVFIRSKPNKSSSKLGSIKNGKTATYLGESSTDSRGVKWYKVKYNGTTGWVSSKYSKLQ
ncbi:MAG: SH3 domain-containing protein, partial [Clostridia bacterium]|nr:SH3 domain-containing protein [Clostridia bacterium]